MKKALITLIGVFIFATAQYAFAAFKIDKYGEKYDIYPGKVVSGTILVENTSNKPITLNCYMSDIVFLPPFDGTKDYAPAGKTSYSCANWISFSPKQFSLPPNRKQKVSYSIQVPETISGGYYGILFFEESSGSSEGIGVKFRIGCGFSLFAPDKERNAVIEDIAIKGAACEGKVLNKGNVILPVKISYYIMDSKNEVAVKDNLNDITLPVGEKTLFSAKLPPKLEPGTYTLFMNFNLGDNKAVAKEVEFTKDESGELKILQVKD